MERGAVKKPAGYFRFFIYALCRQQRSPDHEGPLTRYGDRDTFALPVGLERKYRDMQVQMDKAGQPKAHIAFTEWLFIPDDGDDAPEYDNLGGALVAVGS